MSVRKAIEMFLVSAPFGRKGTTFEAIFLPKGEKKFVAALQWLLQCNVLKYPDCRREKIVPELMAQLDRKLKAAGFKLGLRTGSTQKLVVYVRKRK